MRLNFFEFLKGPVDVQRIKLHKRHAIGDQGSFQILSRRVAQRMGAWKFFDVPEIGPALRAIVAESLGVPPNNIGSSVVEDIRGLKRSLVIALRLNHTVVQGLEQTFLRS